MWLKSDNRAQAETELAIATLEHVAEPGTLGLTYVRSLNVNERFATPAQLERDGMDTVSLRGVGSLGVENLNLSFEYATQDRSSGRENAWYMEEAGPSPICRGPRPPPIATAASPKPSIRFSTV